MSKGRCSLFLLVTALALGHSSARGQQASITWRSDLNAARQEAAQSGRNLLVHFWAPWCGPCRRLETTVFNQPNVAATLQQGLVPVKLNADEFPHIARAFGVDRLPTDVIVRPDGAMLGKFASPQDPTEYVTQIAAFTTPGRSIGPSAEQLAAANGPVQSAYANLHSPRAETVPFRSTAGNAPPHMAGAPGVTTPDGRWSAGPVPPAVTPPSNSYASAPGRYEDSVTATAGSRYEAYAAQPAAGFQRPPLENTASQTAATPQAAAAPAARHSQATSPVQAQPSATIVQAPASGGLRSPDGEVTPVAETSPPVGLDGYCPVTLKSEQRWIAGDKRFGVIHRGRLYLFAGPEQQQQFWANPDHFSPVLSGIDPVLALDNGATVQGRREHGVEYNGLVYLFSSESTLQHFSRNPDRYAGGVRQAMQAGVGTTLR